MTKADDRIKSSLLFHSKKACVVLEGYLYHYCYILNIKVMVYSLNKFYELKVNDI